MGIEDTVGIEEGTGAFGGNFYTNAVVFLDVFL
jgi:hypothetical protein